MPRKGSDLASRFRRAIRSEQEEQVARERSREAALEAARAARVALFEELTGFARAVGFLDVRRTGDALVLAFGTGDARRELTFAPHGDADRVVVSFTGQSAHERHELFRQPELGDIWVWSIRRVRREDRLPLFDSGLEELLVRALGLPRPDDAPPPPSSGGRTL